MALEYILVDTGPLVALLRPDDSEHETCVSATKELRYPFITSWAVLTEAAWLLRGTADGVSKLLAQVELGLIAPLDLEVRSAVWIRAFLEKYHDLGAQIADASLCYLAEREGINRIFTLDRRDFSVYRHSSGKPFELIPAYSP